MKISYKVKFIDSFRFISTSLSSLVDNLSDGHGYKSIDSRSFLDDMIPKADQEVCAKSTFRCFECKKNCEKDFKRELIKRFSNTYELSNGDVNKFILLLRKVFIPMNTWIALMKYHCQLKKLFTVVYTWKILMMLIIDT